MMLLPVALYIAMTLGFHLLRTLPRLERQALAERAIPLTDSNLL